MTTISPKAKETMATHRERLYELKTRLMADYETRLDQEIESKIREFRKEMIAADKTENGKE